MILIAFAIDTPDSLDNVSVKWNDEVRSLCGSAVSVILVGCKKDLRDKALQEGGDSARFVSTEQVLISSSLRKERPRLSGRVMQGQRIADNIGARAYKECSALMNEGVDDVFEAATRAAMLVRTGDDGDRGIREKRNHAASKKDDSHSGG